jgi:aspartate kinase
MTATTATATTVISARLRLLGGVAATAACLFALCRARLSAFVPTAQKVTAARAMSGVGADGPGTAWAAVGPPVAWSPVALLVQKFGGTSVADPDRIREVANHVARCRRRGDSVVLVVSAMGKETDELLRLATEVSGSRPGREMDMLITAGERKAVALVSMALHDLGIDSESYTGSQAGFVTDTNHSNAKIVEVRADRIRAAVDAGRVPVVAGAQGVSTANDVTFLGRGGSDTTAVALAKALDADACELYTDVSGVFTTDPRVVPEARRMHRISFDEMLEMTAAGCPKPAMRSVEYAHRHHVPLHVRSAFTWEPGTWVQEEDPTMEAALIRAVVADDSEAKVTVAGVPDRPGIAASLFRRLADAAVNVDMIVQNVSAGGVTDISFTLPHAQLDEAMAICEQQSSEMGAAGVSADHAIAKVSVVGAGMKSHPGVAARMFETLAVNGINIEMISTSAIRISCVVAEADCDRAVEVLHSAYELDRSDL